MQTIRFLLGFVIAFVWTTTAEAAAEADASAEGTIVTLTAKAILEPNQPFSAVGQCAVDALVQDYKLSPAQVRALQQEAASYFNSKFDLNIRPSLTSDLAKPQLFGAFVFVPFVFIPELNYRIAAHPNPSCISTNVTAGGFLATNLVPVFVKGYGLLPAQTTVIYGRYVWHGSADGDCPRVIVTANSAFPIAMNALGHRAEEYDATHPSFGNGTSHVTAIQDKATGRFEIWTSLQFFN